MNKNSQKSQAIDLRGHGYTLRHISEKTGVSRATLSHWLRDVAYTPNETTIKSVRLSRAKSSITKNKKRIESMGDLRSKVSAEMGEIGKRDFLLMGVGLFAGKGMNIYERIEFSTADIKLATLFLKWLTFGLEIQKSHIFVRLTLFPSHDAARCVEFWSQALKLPKDQIKVGFIDQRRQKNPKFSSVPFGSARIYVKNNGKNELGVKLFRKIQTIIDLFANAS